MAQNLKINILAKDKTKAALNGVRGRLAGLKNAVFSLVIFEMTSNHV